MSKVLSTGTRGPRGPVILKTNAPGGLRKMRCPHCKAIAAPAYTRQGKAVLECVTCHTQFTHQTM